MGGLSYTIRRFFSQKTTALFIRKYPALHQETPRALLGIAGARCREIAMHLGVH